MICPKCNEQLYDNGTVAVHRWNATDKLTIESQACKPAATGSGEPHKWEQQEWITAAATDIAERFAGDGDKGKVRSLTFAIIARHAGTVPMPTPPASQPTVTLDRETLRALLEIAPHFPPSTRYGKAYADALALLRAAEQK